MKNIYIPLLLAVFALTTLPSAFAQTAPSPIRLWNGAAPGALGSLPTDIPTVTPYVPDTPAGTSPMPAVVICPGGGYAGLSMTHEGVAYAQWLNRLGIAGFVLTYRLGSHGYHDPIEQGDADRALRFVRANATKWNIDRHCLGIMGSSAGGHLTATVVTHNDEGNPSATDPIDHESCRPDFGILCYAVVTMTEPFTHMGSRFNLLGKEPTQDQINLLSAEQQVTPNTPPMFIWCTADDPAVPAMNSILMAEALAKNHVPYALHVYPHGVHGLGLGDDNPPFSKALPWTNELRDWLIANGFTPSAGSDARHEKSRPRRHLTF